MQTIFIFPISVLNSDHLTDYLDNGSVFIISKKGEACVVDNQYIVITGIKTKAKAWDKLRRYLLKNADATLGQVLGANYLPETLE